MTSSVVPGGSRSAWGELPLLVDTSAWSHASDPRVREDWNAALLSDRLRIPPLVRLEILVSARGGEDFDSVAERLAGLRPAPLTRGVLQAAQAAMRALAHRSAGAHRLPIVDYLVAAAAQETGASVLHYDADYDTLAGIMDFESVWLARSGSLD